MQPYVSERLGDRHDTSGFASGVLHLDNWLRSAALDQLKRRYSNTFVWTDSGIKVLGYFTISTYQIASVDVPKREARGGPARIPAILLAKLALDESLHGRGLGAQLLVDALTRCVTAANDGPGARLVVDAIDDQAARFYEHFGFKPVPESATRMFRRVSDLAADLF